MVNERIRELRKILDLNQTEFGTRIGIKQGSIAAYESGARTPMDTVILSICREFNVNETWLRTGEGEMFAPMSRSETIAQFAGKLMRDEDESFRRQLIEALAQLDEKEWEVLEGIAKRLTKKD